MTENKTETKLIVGLGNPGKEYENTRHNVGFGVIDRLSQKYKIQGKLCSEFSSWVGKSDVEINQKKIKLILSKPTTFMNNSGFAVAKLSNFYKIDINNIIVIQDEVSLDLGKIRISFARGSGGHHGIESIISQNGNSQNFVRLRFGVGPDPGGDIRADYVLGKFTNKEKKILEKVEEISQEAIEMLLTHKVEDVMNKFNGITVS